MGLHHDKATDQLHPLLNMVNDLEPILTTEVEVGFTRDILAFWCSRMKLREICLLLENPLRALAQLALDIFQRRFDRSHDLDAKVGPNGDFERSAGPAGNGELDQPAPVDEPVLAHRHPGNLARARSMILISSSSN